MQGKQSYATPMPECQNAKPADWQFDQDQRRRALASWIEDLANPSAYLAVFHAVMYSAFPELVKQK